MVATRLDRLGRWLRKLLDLVEEDGQSVGEICSMLRVGCSTLYKYLGGTDSSGARG